MPEQVGSGSTSDRDNLTYIENGDVFYNTETGQLQVRKNDGWTSLTKTITDTNAFKITSGDSVPAVDSNSKEGNIFYNTSTGKIRIREESAWQVTSKLTIMNRDEFKILHGTNTPSTNTLQRIFYNTNTKKLQYLKNDSWRLVAEKTVAGDATPPTIVTEGLMIYLDAANYSGSGTTWPNAAPASSPYPDAILSGNPTYHSENGGVLEFNNTNYASINASSLTSPYNQVLHSFSYNIWIKPSELTNWSCVIDQNVDDYFFGWAGPGLTVYNPRHSPSWTRTSGGGGLGRPYHYRPGRLDLNTWYNLVLTHEVNRLRVYVNAQLVETVDPVDVNYTGTAHWRFMSSGNPPNETAKGKLGIAMVYDRALTHKEVLNNYNIHRERFGTQTATYTAGIPVYSSDAPTVITRYVEIEPAEDSNNNWLSSDYTTPLTTSEMNNNSIVTNQP